MTPDSNAYTLTMAQLYADQGHWQKAVEIYSHLAEEQPENEDLAAALKQAEARLAESRIRRLEDLSPLLRKWLKLQTRFNQLQKLKKLNR